MTIFDLVANKQYQNKHVLTKLIEHHLHVPYKEVILHYEDNVTDAQIVHIDSDYRKYEKDKMPLEYIVGHMDFLGNSFRIDHRAMIPRPETEYMINAVVEQINTMTSVYEILDLGCGCGVLGLSSALLGDIKPLALSSRDISEDAIMLTKDNIHDYQDRLQGIQLTARVSNGLSELQNHPILLERWKKNNLIIVCNYPYIPDETFDINADECARTREPRLAFVGGADGLDLYRVLLGDLVSYQLSHAVLYLEMMTWQMESLVKEFGGDWHLEVVKTFHFNIIIVKVVRK